MGNEIRIKDLNGFLKTAAEQVNVGKDKKLTTDAEISAFMVAADKLVNAGLIDEIYKETLGLTITQETTAAPVVEQYDAPTSRKEAHTERKEQKDYRNSVKKFVKEAVDNTVRADEAHTYERTTIENIVAGLKNEYTNPDYAQAIKEVEEVVALVKATEFNSKKDVNHIKQEIKKGLNSFQRDIVDSLVDMAKEEQIKKETAQLNEIYNAKRKEHEGEKENFTQFVKDVKGEIKEQKIKGSYYGIALDNVKETAKKDSELLQDNKRAKMIESKSENVNGRLVKKDKKDYKTI